MIGAQAAGTDIFGHLARWTDEHLYFIFSSENNARNIEAHDLFYTALKEHDLPTELAPGWYPEGFIASTPEVWEDELGVAVQVILSNEEEEKELIINVDKYKKIEDQFFPFEKDAGPVETYTSQNRTFYIMSNINTITAVWASDDTVVNISGHLTVDEVKKIINSMGGQTT